MKNNTTKKGVVRITEEKLNDIIKLSAIQMLENHEAQCKKDALQEEVDKTVFSICDEISNKRTNMKQQIVRLSENQLMRIIKESVNKVLREGGHLYHKDPETGEVWTNSKETWRGVPGTTYIWHGEWSDPEVIYNGHEYDVYDIEDFMQEQYVEYCRTSKDDCCDEIDRKYAGTQPTEEGYEQFLKDMGTSWIQATLDEFDECMHCDESKKKR